MSQEGFFDYIDNNGYAKEFINLFGGEFVYNINYGCVYTYGKE